MNKNRVRTFIVIVCLIVLTGAAMAYSSNKGKGAFPNWITTRPHHQSSTRGIVNISGHLVQNKILQGSRGHVNLSITLQADEVLDQEAKESRSVNMVIVLDRSGSMKGRKIAHARQAVLELLSGLSAKDRFALVAYSDKVRILSNLQSVTGAYLEHMESVVRNIKAGGGTNLGAGLEAGINLVLSGTQTGNAAKVILISDGLANKGITDPQSLGDIASVAQENEFAVSTVGVGVDFNEYMMNTIADKGNGNYYYLENPSAFAEVFQKEFSFSRTTAATGVSVYIPLIAGMTLVDAAGYPIRHQNNYAVFHPGDLGSGQTRTLFLTLRIPSDRERNFHMGTIKVRYRYESKPYEVSLDESFRIACVRNRKAVLSSIDKKEWTEKVLREDFNKLKQEIAGDIKAGKKGHAMDRLERYYDEQESINAVVGSKKVYKNLNEDIKQLRSVVQSTFQGAPSAVEKKQKENAKSLQFDGYRGRRR